MIELLRPQLTVEPRPAPGEDVPRYLRSYLIMRIWIGALGVALPILLVFIDGLWFDGEPFPRDSLSAYYYSGVRDLFVGILCATGVFLITYKVAERSLDNTLSTIAGVSAVVVALFPTELPGHDDQQTPLQLKWGEGNLQIVHIASATVFIASLGAISFLFGIREGNRAPRPGRRSPKFWRAYHWFFAGVILLAVLWCIVTHFADWPRTSLLIGETASVLAFGASWFMKGLERDMLHK